jgi:hypothetical protein
MANPAFRVRDCELHMKDLQRPINETDVSSEAGRFPVLASMIEVVPSSWRREMEDA